MIGEGVKIGKGVMVGPGCYIGDQVTIGDHTCIAANVSILDGTCVGERVIIHPGAVLGADGLCYATGGYQGPSIAFKLGGRGDASPTASARGCARIMAPAGSGAGNRGGD